MSTGHPGKVVVAFPSTGHDISTRWLASFIQMETYDRHWGYVTWERMGAPESPNPEQIRLFDSYICCESTNNLAKARNKLVHNFMTVDEYQGADWLLFLDTDMVFDHDLLQRIVGRATELKIKILGATCVVVTEQGAIPTLFVPNEDTVTQVLLDYPDDTVAELAATGTGCLLVHRDVFIDMQTLAGGSTHSWFGYDLLVSDTGKEFEGGEDVSFCLRAAKAGHKTHVDTTLHVGHHKGAKVWWPSDVRTDPVDPETLRLEDGVDVRT
jgi:hypothetical protein